MANKTVPQFHIFMNANTCTTLLRDMWESGACAQVEVVLRLCIKVKKKKMMQCRVHHCRAEASLSILYIVHLLCNL